MQTVFTFTLPKGLVDTNGTVHRDGQMRLATAMDEIVPQRDARVQGNEAYMPILLLARVVMQIGAFTEITPELIEQLYAADLVYLQDLYMRINAAEPVVVGALCPHCSAEFALQVAPLN